LTHRLTATSAIPEGSTLEDWPVSYQELEPYYDKVEYAIGVSGKAGKVQGVID
jgi:gluconate 2-dehydrogenase alpha chain